MNRKVSCGAWRRALWPLALCAGLATLLLASGTASADDLASQQAQTLFERGRELMEAGKLEEACALLAESQHLDPGGGTLLNLAVCHEKQGRLATAWAEYNEALSEAVREGRADRNTLASDRIKSLKARLPSLVVELPETLADGEEVRVDGTVLSRLATGAPLPVDPGSHDIAATAPGRVPWSTHLASVAEGQRVEVVVPELELAPVKASSGANREAPRSKRGIPTVTYVSGGVALASYVAMAITGAMALSKQSTVNDAYIAARNYSTDPNAASDASRARTLAWISTATLITGIAATGVAALALLWPKKPSAEAHPLALDSGGEGVGFAF